MHDLQLTIGGLARNEGKAGYPARATTGDEGSGIGQGFKTGLWDFLITNCAAHGRLGVRTVKRWANG